LLIEILHESILARLDNRALNSIYGTHSNRKDLIERLRSLVNSISDIIKYNISKGHISRNPKICMIGIDNNPKIMEIVRIVGNVMRGRFMSMLSLVGISDYGERKISSNAQLGSNGLSEKIDHILNIISNFAEYDLLIFILNIAIAELIAKKISSMSLKKPKVLMITKIARTFTSIANADTTEQLGTKIFESLIDSFRGNGEIKIAWGKKTGGIVSIKVRKRVPKKMLKNAIVLNTPSLRNGWCLLPQGQLKIDLHTLKKYVEIEGHVRIANEPIYGLKCPGGAWLEKQWSEALCEYSFWQTKKGPIIRVKKNCIVYLGKKLSNGVLDNITLGLNRITKEKTLKIFRKEPYLLPYIYGMMTLNIHTAPKKNDTRYFQHIIKNVKICTKGGFILY